ncbi:protein ADP-ribosyltransferase PARP3-like isoform X2 [Arachis hypogaea]|uniref:protein ADP-ribosyltransferase PARP3-like isoform X2 n=1 Tax=Arachis hypogaea TaxID=3818 RepID=UPI003B20D69A
MVHYDALHLGLSFSEIIKRLQNMLLLSLEGVRDITVASHLIGDMSGSTIDDPLSETYNKLGCLISPLEKDSDDYDMIVKYLERTYEPVKVGDMALAQGVLTSYMFTTSARIHGAISYATWYRCCSMVHLIDI